MGIVASLDIDAQKGFSPLCPNELPVAGGDTANGDEDAGENTRS